MAGRRGIPLTQPAVAEPLKRLAGTPADTLWSSPRSAAEAGTSSSEKLLAAWHLVSWA